MVKRFTRNIKNDLNELEYCIVKASFVYDGKQYEKHFNAPFKYIDDSPQ